MNALDFLSDDDDDDDGLAEGVASADAVVKEDASGIPGEEPEAKRANIADFPLDFAALQRAGYKSALGEVDDEAESRAALTSSYSALKQHVQAQMPDRRPAQEEIQVPLEEDVKEALEVAAKAEAAGRANFRATDHIPTGVPGDLPTGTLVIEQRYVHHVIEGIASVNVSMSVNTVIDSSKKSLGYSVVNIFGATSNAEKAKELVHKIIEDGEASKDTQLGCDEAPEDVEIIDDHMKGDPLVPWDDWELTEAGLGSKITNVMRAADYERPTPIQANAWPILASGRDLIGVAKTGSGKTLAFLLPAFAQLLKEGLRSKTSDGGILPVQMDKQAAGPGSYSPEVLVLAPSRELASQIEAEARKFTVATGIATLACYGGAGMRAQQLGQLRQQPECVVGTTGRLNDFIDNESHWFGVRTVRFLVLDEADHMLGEGLNEQIRKITTDVETPRRQTSMFSATFASDVRDLASWVLRREMVLKVGLRDALRANKDVEQRVMVVKDDLDKDGALKTILRRQYGVSAAQPGKVLIFAADPESCDVLGQKISAAFTEANVEVLHGNKNQKDREKAMERFKSGEAPVLVATNIASRGLDIKDIKLVVNYDPPEDAEDYVHRIGRTGRAGRKGSAVTLLRRGPDGLPMAYICQVMKRTPGCEVPADLIYALKQRRGRDMTVAADALKGLVNTVQIDRSWQKEF